MGPLPPPCPIASYQLPTASSSSFYRGWLSTRDLLFHVFPPQCFSSVLHIKANILCPTSSGLLHTTYFPAHLPGNRCILPSFLRSSSVPWHKHTTVSIQPLFSDTPAISRLGTIKSAAVNRGALMSFLSSFHILRTIKYEADFVWFGIWNHTYWYLRLAPGSTLRSYF